MTKEELIDALVMARINEHTPAHPAPRTKALFSNLSLFEEYHLRYPSHGYRWLNAKIRLDTGTIMSDPYAHKCCKILGVKSKAKHYKYKKPGHPFKIYPNLLLSERQIDRPLQCVVSDMTAFYVKGIYYELTLYMDLWNNEILAHALSSRRGDRMTYLSGLEDLVELKNSIRSMRGSSIAIRDPSMRLRHLISHCRCTALPDPCHEPELQRTMRRWNLSTDGSSQKSSWISMSPEKVLLNRK